MLKFKYPYINIHMVQYEMGNTINKNIALVSDRQFVSTKSNIKEQLDMASVVSMTYDTFNIDSYINCDYFDVLDYSSSFGTLSFDESVLTWNLDNSIRTLEEKEALVNLKLKDQYKNSEVVVPVLNKNIINYKLDNISETIDSTSSPIISNYNSVSYDMSLPDTCTVSNYPETKKYKVFDKVEISTDEIVCGGYQFKEWEIKGTDVEKLGSSFLMPNRDVVLVAKWTNLSLSKRMDGKVSKVQTLYDIMADTAVIDNVKSKFVSSSSGVNFSGISSDTNGKGVYLLAATKDDTYPIYYFRGDVDNNNVKFAGFCWKMVRSTENGGVKLIYNGIPDASGYCTNTTRTATQIGTSPYESKNSKGITFGYMYGNLYTSVSDNFDLYKLLNLQLVEMGSVQNTKYYYSDSVTYENGVYTLVNPTQSIYKESYKNLALKYTCLSETETSCTTVKQVSTRNNYASSFEYHEYSNGDTYETLYEANKSKKWVFGNDVTYANGVYTLQTTTSIYISDWVSSGRVATDKKYYTCLSENNTCSTVYYLIRKNSNTTQVYYIALTNGKKMDDIKEEAFTNTYDSDIKVYIDNWYKSNLIDYTKYLENTNWCNEREFGDGSLSSKDASMIWVSYPHSIAYSRLSSSKTVPKLTCDYERDRLNTNITGFNYPVALLTLDEYVIAGGYRSSNKNFYLYTNQKAYTLTPRAYYSFSTANYYINDDGNIDGDSNNYDNRLSLGVRPSIVLKNGVRTDGGNGTMKEPYVINEDVNKKIIN